MDSERKEEILSVCENLAATYINSILEEVAPKILEDFPEFPKNAPEELLFVPPKRYKRSFSTEKTRKTRIKKEKVKVPKSEELNVDELKKSKHSKGRKCRYSGTYNVEKQLSNILDEQSESDDNIAVIIEHPVNDSKGQLSLEPAAVEKACNEQDETLLNLKTFVLKIKKHKKPRIKTLSDTSSDEEEEEAEEKELNLSAKFPMCLIERCDQQLNLSKKFLDLPEKPQTLNGIIKNHQVPQTVIQKSEKEKAIEKYSEAKKEIKKFVPPKVIPAPEQDPAIKKTIRKKPAKANGTKNDESNPNKHLGGIFTINNGWDKQESKKNEGEDENSKEKVNRKLERPITPPNIVIETNFDDVLAAHEEFMYNEHFMDNLLASQDSDSSFSNDSSHVLKIALSNDKIGENKSFKGRKINSSLNSTDDDDDDDTENDEIIKPPKKVQKLSFSDDEDENENEVEMESEVEQNNSNYKEHNDTDVVSLFAEAGELDDLEDEKYCAEVDPDDLKIKVQCIRRKVEPLDHQMEFDLNTNEISQHMVDPETDKILKTIFGNVCPAFLENRCSMPKCQRNHFIPDESRVCPTLIDATFDVLHKVFQVVLRFHRLFQAYISTFVQICIKNKDDKGLAELVKACDRIPRTIVCYKDIVRKLIELDYMKEHRAISFIIAHHTDSEIARDTILSLILESGPCISFFMDYVEKAHMKQPIHSDMFSRILHTCVAYQNPKLPNFCLNYLQGCTATQMKNLNSEHLKAFLQMHKCISELNENREAKALRITQKLLSAMDW